MPVRYHYKTYTTYISCVCLIMVIYMYLPVSKAIYILCCPSISTLLPYLSLRFLVPSVTRALREVWRGWTVRMTNREGTRARPNRRGKRDMRQPVESRNYSILISFPFPLRLVWLRPTSYTGPLAHGKDGKGIWGCETEWQAGVIQTTHITSI